MKAALLCLTPMSASFELLNSDVYEAKEAYDVSLNGWKILAKAKRNVFSLYALTPDTDYELAIGEDTLSFHTPAASLILHLRDFKAPGVGDDTLRVQNAIAVLPENGVLVFDEGEYHLTSVFLKSRIALYFEKGAKVYGNIDPKAYPLMPGEAKRGPNEKPLPILSWEGAPFEGMPSLFTGFHLKDVALVGEGTIDQRAPESPFYDDVKHLAYARPHIFYFNDCENVVLEGLTIRNSASWTIHPYFSKHLGFYDLYLENPKDSPNTDGINPQCCYDVKIIGVRFSVGDDCIALKSGKLLVGKTYKTPSEKIVIRNCYMHEGHGAIVLGSEAGAGIKDIAVERCLFEGTDRGLRIKSRRGRGQDSVIDGIVFSKIIMRDVLTPLAMSMYYFCDPDGKDPAVQDKHPHPVDETTPYLGSFVFEDLRCTGAEVALGVFYGLPEQPIGSVTIRNSSFTMKPNAPLGQAAMMNDLPKMHNAGFLFVNVKSVRLENVKAEGYEGNEVSEENVASLIRT
jgi:polygalacturonase